VRNQDSNVFTRGTKFLCRFKFRKITKQKPLHKGRAFACDPTVAGIEPCLGGIEDNLLNSHILKQIRADINGEATSRQQARRNSFVLK
jgi:hypothetical protein